MAFFVYLYLVIEAADEPGAARLTVHAAGLGTVLFGLYSAYRASAAGRRMESLSSRAAKQELDRLLHGAYKRFPEAEAERHDRGCHADAS